MKSVWAQMLCRLLMVLMVWSPMQMAQAGMIGTDQVASAASQVDRNTVLQFLGRAEVASKLQSYGVDASAARDRVNAMSDQEVQQLAGKIQSMPAGADSTGTIVVLLLVAAVVWWVWFRK
jgi:cobalamin biosynthesis Mg chelatase CobN